MIGAHYISNLSPVDVQGIVDQETVQQDHIQMLRSMRLHHNLDFRTSLPYQHCITILEHSELLRFDTDIKQLEEKMEAHDITSELRHQREIALGMASDNTKNYTKKHGGNSGEASSERRIHPNCER